MAGMLTLLDVIESTPARFHSSIERSSIMLARALISLTLFLSCFGPVSGQFENQLQQDAAQVQVLLDEIRIEGLKKFGAFSDYNPQKTRELVKTVNFTDGTEASVNRPVMDYLFENDIVLTVPQAHGILEDIKESKGLERKPRQAQPGEKYYWKNKAVSYKFKINDATWRGLIRKALAHLEDQTCMRFHENGADPDYLEYTRAGGCWSNVGRVGGRQTVSIGYGCEAIGIIAHETLHALGLWHEQARFDRDGYVDIDFSYIFPGTQYNFAKRTPANSENLGQRYDLGSVMHYGAKAFSTDYSQNTIVTKDENYQNTIGQRLQISFKDARMINSRYCDDVCEKKLDCLNGGYTDPNDCSKCRCPSGLAGKLCDELPASSPSTCGGKDHRAAPAWQTIESPILEEDMNCFWKIAAAKGKSVEIEFTSSSFPCGDACSSFVELKHLADKTTTGARICCEIPKTTIITEDNLATLWLRSDTKFYTGFKLRFREVDSTATTSVIPVTTTTTTEKSTTTREGSPAWSEWGGWSGCSVPCGGCGKRQRIRACYGGNGKCDGSDNEHEFCGQDPCPMAKKTTRCTGRLVMPCDLLNDLDFGTTQSSDPSSKTPELELLQTKKNADTLKRIRREHSEREKRFVDGNKQMAAGNFCEKRFSYNCPTSLLTINIDRKTNSDMIGHDSRLCCPGYYRSQGKCVKDSRDSLL